MGQQNKTNIIWKICFVLIAIIVTLLWVFIGFKSVLLSVGIFSLMFYINIATTTLGNAFIGRNIDPNYDIFWKIFFIVVTALSFGIYFNI